MNKLSKIFCVLITYQLLIVNANASSGHDAHSAPISETHKSVSHENAQPDHQVKSESSHDNHHARKKGKDSPQSAYTKLLAGHKRYMQMSLRKDGKAIKDRQKLATGQEPHTVILSCSDSRVPPEIIFDQALGEIFVIRTAGQMLDSSSIASIEYAVSHLGTNLIVVMGHESCGAVKAALDTLKGADAGSSWLNKLVGDIHPRVRKFSDLPRSEGVVVESWSNVIGVSEDLRLRSKIIDDAVKSGDVEIKKALYHLGSGNVEWRD